MTSSTVQPMIDANAAALKKGVDAAEQTAKTNGDALAKNAAVAEKVVRTSRETATKSGNAAIVGFQELTEAYQALARRNTEKLTESIQALSTVRTPMEFVELQQKLLTEGVAAAVNDGATIAKLTTAAFAAAFEPMRKQVDALQGGLKR